MSLALGKNNVNAKQPLHLDATNHLLVNDSTNKAVLDQIATNTANINVNVGDVEINVADLEALQATTNTTLAAILVDTDAADSSLNTIEAQSVLTASRLNNIQNKISANTDGTGDTLGQIASNILTSVQLLDNAISGNEMQVDIVSSALPTGGATEATLAANEAHVGSIDGKITACNTGSISGTVAVSAVSGNVACTHASLPLPSGAATESTLSAAEVHLGNIETAVQLIDNAISGNEMQVDIVSSALPTGAATSANQSTLIGHVDNVESKLDDIIGHNDGVEGLLTTIDEDTNAIKVSAAAMVVDLAAIEVINTNAEVHLGNIDAGVDVLEACVGSNKVNVNISSGNITGFSTSANQSTLIGHVDNVESKLDDIIGHNDGVEGLLTTIDEDTNAIKVSAAAMVVDLAANEVLLTGIDQKLGDIETSVQAIDDIALAEDAAHSSGQKGVMFLGVRQSSQADFAADGDYTPLSIDDDGKLRVTSSTVSGGATEAKQDVIETTLTAIETDAAALEVLQTATNSKLDHLSGDLDTIEATLTAIETDQAAIEVLLTAANTDHAANEVLLTAIDADTSNIATSTAACATDLAALEVLQTSTNSKLDHLSGDLDTLETTLTAIETDAAANEVLLTNINSKLADIETAIEIIDNGYGTMTEETLLNATVTGSGGSATSSVHTKKREIENIGFSINGASHGTYTAVIQFSVDNVDYHDDTNLNFGNAQLCKGTITSIGRGFKYYKVRIVNNGVDQNTTVKISY